MGFNSLRTGRHIQSLFGYVRGQVAMVFQFPTNGKAYPKLGKTTVTETGGTEFQFPTNGKAYPK